MTGFKAGLVLLSALVAQWAVISRLDLFGAHGDLLILVPVAAALTVGPSGARSPASPPASPSTSSSPRRSGSPRSPTASSATASAPSSPACCARRGGCRWSPRVAGAVVGTSFWAVAATVVGEEGLLTTDLIRIVLAVSLVAMALVLPSLRLARWVEADLDRPLVGAR